MTVFLYDDLKPVRIVYADQVDSLNQYRTYEGHMMGRPTTVGNKRDLERLVELHTQPKGDGAPYLIKPTETPLPDGRSRLRPAGPATRARMLLRSNPQDGTPARLPRITCIARFTSGTLANDSDGSALRLQPASTACRHWCSHWCGTWSTSCRPGDRVAGVGLISAPLPQNDKGAASRSSVLSLAPGLPVPGSLTTLLRRNTWVRCVAGTWSQEGFPPRQ